MRVVTGAAGCVTPQIGGVTQPMPRCGVAAWVGPCAAPGRLRCTARVAARNAPVPGAGWTPVTGRLGTRCRKGRPGAPLRVAPCTGKVTCFTVMESRSRVAADASRLARSCGHLVSGRTMNKATWPPSGSANGAGTLLSAPSRTGRKEVLRATRRRRLARRPAWCRLDTDQGDAMEAPPVQKDRCPAARYY